MANKGVKVTITAVDRASQTLERINAKTAAMQAPYRRMAASINRFSNVHGLTSLRNGLTNVARAGAGAFQTLGQIVPVMGILTGAASVAGIYKLATAWGQFGTNLRTAANNMGMAPSRLMAMQNAARLSGGSGEAVSSALQGLTQTRWEATHGFAPEAIVQFKALGISLRELQHLKPDEMFERVAKRIRAIRDPAAKMIAATQVFGGAAQGLMPILQQTEAQYQANIKAAYRFGVMNRAGADAADRLRQAQTGLELAVKGFGFSLAQSVEPVIRPVVEHMADWIAANRAWVAQDITGYVKQFVTWLQAIKWDQVKNGIKSIYDRALRVVDALGGWKRAGEIALGGIALLYSAPMLAGIAMLTAALLGVSTAFGGIALAAAGAIGAYEVWQHYKSPDAAPDPTNHLAVGLWKKAGGEQGRAQQAYDYFRSQGRSRNAALGMVSNIDRESTFLETNSGDNGKAYGLGQWWPKRQERFRQLMGKDIRDSTFAEQLQFYNLELKKDYPYADANVNMARTPEAAAQALTYGYEQPKHQDTEAAIRGEMADQWASKLGDAKVPAPINSAGAAATQPASLKVEIDHRNAPAGSSVQVKSATPGLRVYAISQHRAMDPALTAVGH